MQLLCLLCLLGSVYVRSQNDTREHFIEALHDDIMIGFTNTTIGNLFDTIADLLCNGVTLQQLAGDENVGRMFASLNDTITQINVATALIKATACWEDIGSPLKATLLKMAGAVATCFAEPLLEAQSKCVDKPCEEQLKDFYDFAVTKANEAQYRECVGLMKASQTTNEWMCTVDSAKELLDLDRYQNESLASIFPGFG